MVTKLIKELDEDAWNEYVGFCKMKDVKIGVEMNKILEEYNMKARKRMLKK